MRIYEVKSIEYVSGEQGIQKKLKIKVGKPSNEEELLRVFKQYLGYIEPISDSGRFV